MEKRYQVFVSSTFLDLQDERREVMQALLELNCIPSGMELFPAADEDQWALIKKVIDDCDYYIVIVAGRYGSVHPKTGESYTEMEYRYAKRRGKPIIGFVHSDVNALPGKRVDQDHVLRQKLEAFRALVKQKPIRTWNTSAELGSVVSRSMVRLISTTPKAGWVRADKLNNEVTEATLGEIGRLRNEVAQLMVHTKVSEAVVRTGLNQVGFEPTDIDWTTLFKAQNVDLFFVYARTWRANNAANLRSLVRRQGAKLRVVLPDPENEVILEELGNRMGKSPADFQKNIIEARDEIADLAHLAKKSGAAVSMWLASVTPIYSLYRFDDTAVLALNSYQRHRGNVPHFVAVKDGQLYRFVTDEFQMLIDVDVPRRLSRGFPNDELV